MTALRVLLCAAFCTRVFASGGDPGVLIFFDYQTPISDEAFTEMEQEVSQIMSHPGIQVQWKRQPTDCPEATTARIVVLRFLGECKITPTFAKPEVTPGALAITHMVNGEILPFSDVICDRLRPLVESAMGGEDPKHADKLLGRAMGRVIAHELWHIITQSRAHGRRGVTRPWLTGYELIADHIELTPADLERVEAARPKKRQQVEAQTHSAPAMSNSFSRNTSASKGDDTR